MCTNIDRHPGKFEVESCITRYAYHWALNGDGDTQSDDNGHYEIVFSGPFTSDSIADMEIVAQSIVCFECYGTLRRATNILLFESSDGFVTSRINLSAQEIADWWTYWERQAEASEDELVDYSVSV